MKIGLTGGIGSGKSTVAQLLADRGAVVIDADAIAREIVKPGETALAEIVNTFGPEVLLPDGTLDRAGLAAVVFADEDARARLDAITHPRIAERGAELIAAAPVDAVVVYDMPLLVEQGAQALRDWDRIVVVDAPDDVRLSRLIQRGLSPDDARRRMVAQASREERLAVADDVIDNGTDLAGLEAQVNELWSRLHLG